MNRKRLVDPATLGAVAVLAVSVTLLALQTHPEAVAPSFTADYYEVSHKHAEASNELLQAKHVVRGRFWRDRQGRLRQEDWEEDAQGNRSNQRVFITDPTLHVQYQLKSDLIRR